MDEKKVIAKLASIVANQQKIIMKLAQAQGLPPDSLPTSSVNVGGGHAQQLSDEPPPNKLDPSKFSHDPAGVFYSAMSPAQRAMLTTAPNASGDEMRVSFKPDQRTQANYNALKSLLTNLINTNKIQHVYNLKA